MVLRRLLVLGIVALLLGVCAEAGADVAVAATPALSLSATPGAVVYGGEVTLAVAGAVPGSSLALSAVPAGAPAPMPVATLTADASGAAAATVRPDSTTVYRIEFAGDGTWAAAAAETTVAVSPRLALVTSTASAYPGQRVLIRVAAFPDQPGAAVTVEARVGGTWKTWKTLTLDKDSRAAAAWRPAKSGTYVFRATTAAGAAFAAAAGREKPVKVKRATQYGVPSSAPHLILTDRSQYRLYYFEHGEIVRVFNCVLGRPGLETPLGHFQVYSKGINPGGPFGVRVLWYHGGHGIHGTNEPWLLSRFPRNFSHGCTRMLNPNALWLFDHCPVGTPVWNVL
jgi:lipoprotein-anchoring transpeptidase ErfK/SrfK